MGARVEVDPNFPDHTPYIGLDWFILDLLGSSLIFIFIEKLFAHRKDQPVFRAEWQTDFHHFIVNHMVVGFVLLATNLIVHKFFGWAANDGIRGWVRGLNFWVALFVIILVADLVQYWTHRAYHEVPLLWRLHAVHHSVKSIGLDGRLAPAHPGADHHPLDGAGAHLRAGLFQGSDRCATSSSWASRRCSNHANVSVRLGPLRYVLVTPNFHHWHHSQDQEAPATRLSPRTSRFWTTCSAPPSKAPS